MHSFPSTLITLFVRPQVPFSRCPLLQLSKCSHSYPSFSSLLPPVCCSFSPDCCMLEWEILWEMGKNIGKGLVQEIVLVWATPRGRNWPYAKTPQHPHLTSSYTSYTSNTQCWMSPARVPQTGNAQLSHSASSASLSPVCTPLSKHISKTLPAVFSLAFPVFLCLTKLKPRPKQWPNWQDGGHGKRRKINQGRRSSFRMTSVGTEQYIDIYICVYTHGPPHTEKWELQTANFS